MFKKVNGAQVSSGDDQECVPDIRIHTPHPPLHARHTGPTRLGTGASRWLPPLLSPPRLSSCFSHRGERGPARTQSRPTPPDPSGLIQILDSRRHNRAWDGGGPSSSDGRWQRPHMQIWCGESKQWEVENVGGRGAPAAEREGSAVMRKGSIGIHIGNRRRPTVLVPLQVLPVIARQRYGTTEDKRLDMDTVASPLLRRPHAVQLRHTYTHAPELHPSTKTVKS